MIWRLQYLSVMNCAFHQVFIKCTNDQLEDVHLLVLKVVGKSVPVAMGRMQADAINCMTQSYVGASTIL